MNLTNIEKQLRKRLSYPYRWGRKQEDDYDKKTNFIYKVRSFDTLLETIGSKFGNLDNYQSLFDYSLNRWFNFWSAKAIEEIFCSLKGVIPNKNKYDKLVDFEINGIKFDHKTSIFPKGFGKDIHYATKNKRELIRWLYENQSQQQRKHLKNRLFIVLYSGDGEHWKLKAKIMWLKKLIENYVSHFNPNLLEKFPFSTNELTLSDIIWGVR